MLTIHVVIVNVVIKIIIRVEGYLSDLYYVHQEILDRRPFPIVGPGIRGGEYEHYYNGLCMTLQRDISSVHIIFLHVFDGYTV